MRWAVWDRRLSDPADKAAAYRHAGRDRRMAARTAARGAGRRSSARDRGGGRAPRAPGAAAAESRSSVSISSSGRGAELAAGRSSPRLTRRPAAQATTRAVAGSRLASRRIRRRPGGQPARGPRRSRPVDGAVLDAAVPLATKLGRDRDRALALETSGGGRRRRRRPPPRCCARRLRRASARHAPERGGWPRRCRCCGGWSRRTRPRKRVALLDRHATRAGDWPHAILARRQLAELSADADDARGAVVGARLRAPGERRSGRRRRGLRARHRGRTPPSCRRCARWPGCARRAATRERAAEMYAREARLTKAPGRAADAFRQAARLYANQVRDDAMAGRCLEEVLALEPEAETDFEVLDVILRAARRLRSPGAGDAAPRGGRAGAQAARSAAGTGGAHLRARSDRGGVGAGARRSRWIRRRWRRWCAWPRSRPRSGDPRKRSRRSVWRSRRRPIRRASARRGSASATSPSARSPTSRRRSTRTATRCCRRPTICPRSRGWRGAWSASATGPTPRRRCGGWRPSRSERDARVGHLVTLGELLAGPAEDPEGAADAFEGALAVPRATPSRWIAWTRS